MPTSPKHPFIPYFFGLLLGIAAAPSCTHAQVIDPGAPVRREVRGTILDSASSMPIPGASITIVGSSIGTTTDERGTYTILGFLPSTVTLLVRHLGYTPVTRRIDLSHGNATVNLALAPRAATLSGITTTADTNKSYLAQQQATSKMSRADITQKRGQTLGETIKDLPGVSIIQYGPSIAKPMVRGLHSQRIATINAGVPQEGQQWGGEHAPEIDAFAANEIEVIRGPGTILYGSGALGGVVRVMPRQLPTEGAVGGEFSLNAFSNNRQGAGSLLLQGAHLPFPLVGDLGWRVQVSGRRAGDAATPDYYLPNTGYKELDYSAAIGLTRPWGLSELNLSHFGTTLGLYVGAHVGNLDDLSRAMDAPLTTSQFSSALARPNQKVAHDLLSWHTLLHLPDAAQLDVAYGLQHNNRREYDNHGFAVGARPAFALELYTHTLDIHYHQAPRAHLTGTFGMSGMRQGNLSPGRSFLIPQYRLYTGGLFGLEQLTYDRFSLTMGARYDYRWQHAYQYGAPVVVSPNDVSSYTGVSGSIGASYKLTGSWSLASTVNRAWRPPNVNERFSQGVHHGTAQYEIGDTSLTPESSLNADVTLRHSGAISRFELSAFRNQIDDYIYLQPREPISTVRGAYPAYNYAHTDALLHGFEITGQLTPSSWIALNATGDVVRGRDRNTGDPLYDMPADRVTGGIRVYVPSHSWLSAPYAGISTTLVRKQNNVPPVTIYKLPTEGYALMNLEFGATALQFGKTRLEPSLTVRNVFNRAYRDYLSRYRLFVDEPGRDLVLRITMPFGAAR